MVISQGEIWWADLGDPLGSAPVHRRPVIVTQSDAMNRSRIATVICIPLTSNLQWATAPGNILLPAKLTTLSKDSVANASQILTLNKSDLTERTAKLPSKSLKLLHVGVAIVLGQ